MLRLQLVLHKLVELIHVDIYEELRGEIADTKKYGILSEKLNEAGKMLGGWMRQANKANTQRLSGFHVLSGLP